MTTKKKATKKKATPSKARNSSQKKLGGPLKKVKTKTKKVVDDFLVKLSPALQSQVEQMVVRLEKTPTSVGDLKVLGLRVLERAKKFSQTLKKKRKQT